MLSYISKSNRNFKYGIYLANDNIDNVDFLVEGLLNLKTFTTICKKKV